MIDVESLICGIFVGMLITTFSVFLQDWKAKNRLKIQLDHDDRKKAYLELWRIHNKYNGLEWAKKVEELLDSPEGVFLKEIKLKLKKRIDEIRKKYEKEVFPIIAKTKTNMELAIENMNQNRAILEETLKAFDPEKKRRNIENKFNKEVQEMNKDIPDLIKENWRKLK